MDQVDAQRLLLLELANDLEAIDRIVNDDVQPLIVAETLEALNGAEASVDGATKQFSYSSPWASSSGLGRRPSWGDR